METQKLSVADFAAKIKAKYPDYANIDDAELTQRIIAKYPEYADSVEQQKESPSLLKQFGAATKDQLIGMAKGVGSTAYGTGLMLRKYIPGLAWAGNTISDYTLGHHASEEELEKGRETLGLMPTNLAQKIGFGAEQIGEYFVPGAAIGKGVKLAEAGSRFAAAMPKLAKGAPVAEYAARGALEAVPAAAIATAQGQEDVGNVASFAFAGPTFGKLLNKTGASKAAGAAAKGVLPKKIAEKIPEVQQSPRQMMWRALKPYVRNRDFDKALDRAMPEIYEQARMSGKQIKNVDDFLEVLQATKKRVWAPYKKMVGESIDTVSGPKIADAIEESVSKYHTIFEKAKAKSVKKLADVYRKQGDVSLSEAENWLEVVNAQIKAYYDKYPQMRQAAQKASPMLKAKLTEAGELRSAINEAIDNMGGVVSSLTKDPYSAKMFKEVYGGLQNLEQEAYRRVNVARRLAPESLTEQMSKVHAAGEFAWALVRGHPLQGAAAIAKGVAYRKAAEVIKKRNTSDYLLEQAFKYFGEYVEQEKKAHRIFQGVAGAGKD